MKISPRKEWMIREFMAGNFVLTLCSSSHWYICCKRKDVQSFKERHPFKARRREKKNRMRLPFTSESLLQDTTVWKQWKENNIPVQLFSCSFHISLDKLWTHFLIHWIGDNLLLLLTSLVKGPKKRKMFCALKQLVLSAITVLAFVEWI